MNPVEEPSAGGEEARFRAQASDQARIYQAGRDQNVSGRDLHLHYEAGVRKARRVESGAEPGQCPYPGLSAFGAEQARWFFGRDVLTADLMVRLDERLREGGALAVVAPSGAGKSSLLRAGLLPAIARGSLPVVGSARWPCLLFTPTGHPVQALAAQLAEVTGSTPERMGEVLSVGPTPCVAMVREALQGRTDGGGTADRRLVVVVDQLEELFTLCTDEHERRDFLSLLSALAAPGDNGRAPAALVVYGLRSDFYTQCANYPELRTTLQNDQVLVGPLSEDGLQEAIQYPAQDVGLEIEPGLVELLLRDLGTPAHNHQPSSAAGAGGPGRYEAGRLPLLAHALRATWQQNGSILTVDGYRATGGIHHAIATTAETRFNKLDPLGMQTARTLFLRLVKIGDGVDDTRRRVPHEEILSASGNLASSAAVISTFTEGRLLTHERDTVEITHEALLHAWPRLRQWIDTDRAGNLIRQELEEAGADWERNGRDAGALYRGSRLEAARAWANTRQEDSFGSTASAFLAASVRQKRRATRRRRSVIVVLSILALIASGTAAVAFQQRATAQSERATAKAERDTAIYLQTVSMADSLRGTDPSLAAQLDLVAYRMRPTLDLSTHLMNDANSTLSMPLEHPHKVASAVLSPDGKSLASSSFDGTVRLWNLTDPMHPKPLGKPLTDGAQPEVSVVFSRDGKLLASGGGDKVVRLWDLSHPMRPRPLGKPLTGHTDAITSVAFSPDGNTLASTGHDRTIRLWNLADPARAVPLGEPVTGHSDDVNSLDFSPDGRALASASRDGTVRLWNVADLTHPAPLGKPLTGHDGPVWSALFSPDGRALASAGADKQVRLWNLADPARPVPWGNPLAGHTDIVSSVAFSPDGRILASAGGDGTVRLWNLADPARPVPLGEALTGHDGPVTSIAFGPDGYTLASASFDGTVRLWSRPRTVLTGHSGPVWSIRFSPDGHTLASASRDGTVRLWNLADPARPVPLGEALTGHDGHVYSVAFSPDGRTLASASSDKTVRLWNLSDPARPKPLGNPLRGHTDLATYVAFSPDGRTLASTSQDKTVRLWNLTDPAHPRTLGEPIIGHTDGVWSAAFSPDGRTLATASNDISVRLWNVTDPDHVEQLGERLTGHAAPVSSVAFTSDGHTLVSGGSDNQVRLWNVTDPAHPKHISAPAGFAGPVTSALFNRNGKRLYVASEDKTVRLLDSSDSTAPLRMGKPLVGHLAGVQSLDLSPDENTLASGSYDFTVRLWTLNGDSPISQVCRATGNITREQWKVTLPQLPFAPPCPDKGY
ncbi:hypothetical protein OG427_02875 [Streptomyces sp. NBC_00133]|uniref:nSTAND1 domain-containing NTPase n=1 Tax=Streptomyces sp. NBC_00133 TaxID=2903624 RepID=UPI00324D9BF8